MGHCPGWVSFKKGEVGDPPVPKVFGESHSSVAIGPLVAPVKVRVWIRIPPHSEDLDNSRPRMRILSMVLRLHPDQSTLRPEDRVMGAMAVAALLLRFGS